MDYARYCDLAEQADKHATAGSIDKAISVFTELVNSDISELDKSLMSVNIATLHERAGRVEDALANFDHAIAYERRHHRHTAAEYKAAFLSRIGRSRECLKLYEDLVGKPWLTEAEKYKFSHNIEVLKKSAGAR
jgi:tetratricopeptide (TPR) repeat protein